MHFASTRVNSGILPSTSSNKLSGWRRCCCLCAPQVSTVSASLQSALGRTGLGVAMHFHTPTHLHWSRGLKQLLCRCQESIHSPRLLFSKPRAHIYISISDKKKKKSASAGYVHFHFPHVSISVSHFLFRSKSLQFMVLVCVVFPFYIRCVSRRGGLHVQAHHIGKKNTQMLTCTFLILTSAKWGCSKCKRHFHSRGREEGTVALTDRRYAERCGCSMGPFLHKRGGMFSKA